MWPWRRRRPPPIPLPPAGQKKEQDDALERLATAKDMEAKAGSVARRSVWSRDRNHFTELIVDIFRSVKP
jgi:hypothetical protein